MTPTLYVSRISLLRIFYFKQFYINISIIFYCNNYCVQGFTRDNVNYVLTRVKLYIYIRHQRDCVNELFITKREIFFTICSDSKSGRVESRWYCWTYYIAYYVQYMWLLFLPIFSYFKVMILQILIVGGRANNDYVTMAT